MFVHGGVSFDPYRRVFAELVDRPLRTLETYVASEAYIAFQPAPERDMVIMFDNGVFYEFVPFTEDNFTNDGKIREAPDRAHDRGGRAEYAVRPARKHLRGDLALPDWGCR